MLDSILSNSILGIPILVLISIIIKGIYFNSNKKKDESNSILDEIFHAYHDVVDKVITFCPHCEKKYKVPPDIGIKVECPSCNKVNYHNI